MTMEQKKDRLNLNRLMKLRNLLFLLNILWYPGNSYQEETLVKNFTCMVYNFDQYVKCTWQLDVDKQEMSSLDVNVTWQLLDHLHNCTNQTKTSCILTRENSGNLHMERSIDFHITVENVDKGTSVTNSFHAKLLHLVKPSPVSHLSGKAINSRCVKLSWMHPYNTMELLYLIEYSDQWNNKMLNDSVYGDFDSFDDITDRTICSLIPYTYYVFNVFAKPRRRGFWSKSESIQLRTQKDVPSCPPLIPPRAFRQKISSKNGSRDVSIFWQGLREQHKNGDKLAYKVIANEAGSCGNEITSTTEHTSIILSGLNQVYTYNVTVRALNEKGESKNLSAIVIPPVYKSSESTSDVIAIGYSNFTEVRWNLADAHEDVSSITFYWCQKSLHSDIPCSNDIQWKSILPLNNTGSSYIETVLNSSYLFGASTEYINGQTSGLQWTDCFVMNNKMHHDLKTTLTPRTGGQVSVSWEFVSCTSKVFKGEVHRYVLEICKTTPCNVSEYESTDGNTISTVIHNAVPGETLCVVVTAELKYGLHVNSNKVCEKIYAEKHVPYALIIVGGLIVLVLFCLGVWFVTRKFAKKLGKCMKPFEIENVVVNVPIRQSETRHNIDYDDLNVIEAHYLTTADEYNCLTPTTEQSLISEFLRSESQYTRDIDVTEDNQESQSLTGSGLYSCTTPNTEESLVSQYLTRTDQGKCAKKSTEDKEESKFLMGIYQTSCTTPITRGSIDSHKLSSCGTPSTEESLISMNSAGYVVRDFGNR